MNKPGGAAWILAVHENSTANQNETDNPTTSSLDDITNGVKEDVRGHDKDSEIVVTVTYDVKYVLNGNQDLDVPDYYVVPFKELERRSRKRGLQDDNKPSVISSSSSSSSSSSHSSSSSSRRPTTTAAAGENDDALAKNTKEQAHKKKKKKTNKNVIDKIKNVMEIFNPTDSKVIKAYAGLGKKTAKNISNRSNNMSHGNYRLDQRIRILPTSLKTAELKKLEKFIEDFSVATTIPPASLSSSSLSSSSANDNNKIHSNIKSNDLDNTSKINPTLSTLPSLSSTDKFDKTVTHIVVPMDKNGDAKRRTMKFMQAIMGKIFINKNC